MSGDLTEHRAAIDRLDRELVRLLNQRATHVQRIGAAKAAQGGAIFVPHRELEVFRRIEEANQGPLAQASLRAIWREIMSASFALERPLNICHFGQAGAFTHLAAKLKFGDSVSYIPAESLATVFNEVERGHADYGVVPIENSTDGTITDTIDAIAGSPLRIINEVSLRIRHHLLARCPRTAIKRIYSRHTVFGQCRKWLAANLPGIELVELVSTTKAAERAAAEPDAAALASEDAATAFALPILASDIQDNPHNITRFVVIATRERAAQPTGTDKTSLMFGSQDRPGALYDCLLPFHRAGINLCRIESRPSKRRPWEYNFFIDLLGHQQDATVRAALDELAKHTTTLEVLGSYPRSELPLND
jgi:chorismate mutase/prephenate dehydratase